MSDEKLNGHIGDQAGLASNQGSQESGLDLQRLLFSHKLILLLMLSVGLAAGYAQYDRATPEYASSAKVLVSKNEVTLPVEGVDPYVDLTALDTHIELMRTPEITDKAVAILKQQAEAGILKKLPAISRVSDEQFAANIAGGLQVRRSSESLDILDLSIRSSDPADCQVILNAVVKAYIDFIQETQAGNYEETAKLINGAMTKLLRDRKDLEAKFKQFCDASPLVTANGEPINIHRDRLAEIESQRSQIGFQRQTLQAELASIDELRESGASDDVILYMVQRRDPRPEVIAPAVAGTVPDPSQEAETPATGLYNPLLDPELALPLAHAVEVQLTDDVLKLEELKRIRGSAHPDVVNAKKALEEKRKILTRNETNRRTAIMRVSQKKALAEARQRKQEAALAQAELEQHELGTEKDLVAADLLKMHITAVHGQIRKLDRNLASLNEDYEVELTASRRLSEDENEYRRQQEDLSQNKQLFNTFDEKLREIDLVNNSGFLTARLISPPGPGHKVAPVLMDHLVLAGFLGLLGGLALSFMLEASDRSFRGPEQIMSQLGLPVVGHIPTISGKSMIAGSKVDKSLVAFHRPKSRLAESYRAIRVPLLFSAKQQGFKVLQVTSPDPGDGKSTLAANLAIVMASTGKKCLLIDADFRRPKVHKLFGVANDRGVSAVINGQSELADAIQPSEAEHLELLTTGPRVKNPAELILSPQFEASLQVLREKYDFIIMDTPPVLAVTDAAAVASRVDAVLLVLRISKRVQLHASRSYETLKMVGATLMGVAVNGIGESTGYAYGTGVYSSKSSKYQYSQSAAYNSNYEYGGGSRYSDYYLDADADDAPDGRPLQAEATH